MIFPTLLALALFGNSEAADCMSNMNKRCMMKSEVGDFASFMIGGDPCFLYNNNRVCFVAAGSMNGCSCTPECGCTDAPVVPACDNSAVPKDDQRIIVDTHNALRCNVAKGLETKGANGRGPQPKAANMFQLSWDPVLADSAQRWADQCISAHDSNRLIPAFSYVGQNMADSWSSVNSPDKRLASKIQMWYDEVANWPAANVGSFSQNGATGVVGHYTQLIWGATTKIGCGYVMYVDAKQLDTQYRQTLICNYGIGGNMMGSKVYTVGEVASSCPNGSNDGLCL